MPGEGRKLPFPFCLGLIGLLSLGLSACDKTASSLKLRVGQTVPPLAVEDLSNRPVSLTPTPGKVMIINYWATWCPPCRHEMPSLQELSKKLGNERFELVGLSVDKDEHVVREYLIENKINFPSFLDRNFTNANDIFGIRVFPSTFFLSPDGHLLWVVEGWQEWDTPEMVEDIRSLLPETLSTQGQKP